MSAKSAPPEPNRDSQPPPAIPYPGAAAELFETQAEKQLAIILEQIGSRF